MTKLYLNLLTILYCLHSSAQPYKKLHFHSTVVDTHNDILMKAADRGIVFDKDLSGQTHSDLNRWKKGGLDVQLFSLLRRVSYRTCALAPFSAESPTRLVRWPGTLRLKHVNLPQSPWPALNTQEETPGRIKIGL